MSETGLMVIFAILLVIGLGLIGLAFFKWLFYIPSRNHTMEKKYSFMGKEVNSKLDLIVFNIIFIFCGGMAYIGFSGAYFGPFVATVTLSVFLFPDGIPRKGYGQLVVDKANFIHTIYIIMISLFGWYLNQYIYMRPETEQIIWICVLPVVYGLIYWKVKSHKKVKEL